MNSTKPSLGLKSNFVKITISEYLLAHGLYENSSDLAPGCREFLAESAHYLPQIEKEESFTNDIYPECTNTMYWKGRAIEVL